MVITFGEILLRLSGLGYNKLFQKDSLDVSFCGSEANVAVSLTNYGIETKFVSKVPNNDVGLAAVKSLKYFGVDISEVIYGGDRLGTYYLEKGASQRPSKVIYDRMHSSISQANLHEFDWETIFKDATWFHFSGINPALSDTMKEISLKALKVAKEMGITTSCDLNYRSKLWSETEAVNTMTEIMKFVDVCIANEEDAEKVLNIKASDTDVSKGILSKDKYNEVAKTISNKFGCRYVAFSFRKSISANYNKWSGGLYSKKTNQIFYSKEYDINIVDRVGSGDSFAAGIIYALLSNINEQDSIEFAVAASCLKHSIEGDFNRVSVEEVMNLVYGDSTGRVKR